jgi:Zn-dependent protease
VRAKKVEFHRIFCKLEERESPAGNVFPSFYEVADGNFSILKGICVEYFYILPILFFSVVVHEVAHGLMALRLGDPTARDMGRLTFNPIPHIDFFGSIVLPLMAFFTKIPIMVAWAKPVPINPANFKNYRRDDILVSLMGPLSNFGVALLCVFGYVFTMSIGGPLNAAGSDFKSTLFIFITKMFAAGISLNIFLAVFNLIPVPPLDGSHVLCSLLPEKIGEKYRRLGFAGILIVLVLLNVQAFRNFMMSIVYILQLPYEYLLHCFGF